MRRVVLERGAAIRGVEDVGYLIGGAVVGEVRNGNCTDSGCPCERDDSPASIVRNRRYSAREIRDGRNTATGIVKLHGAIGVVGD